jgi:hypothetical protein
MQIHCRNGTFILCIFSIYYLQLLFMAESVANFKRETTKESAHQSINHGGINNAYLITVVVCRRCRIAMVKRREKSEAGG